MNKRLLAIYTAVFIIVMIMLYLYRQSYDNLTLFSREVKVQTNLVIRLQNMETLLKLWLSNNRKVKDDLDAYIPADLAYDSLLSMSENIGDGALYLEQRLRMDSLKLNVRNFQRLSETTNCNCENELAASKKTLLGLIERSVQFGFEKMNHRTVRLQESTKLLDKWLFWMLSSAAMLILLATFYSFNFLRLRRRAESFSKTLLENTNNGIISFYPLKNDHDLDDYKITYCNEAALSLLKITDWKSKTLASILSHGVLQDVRKAFKSVIATGESTMIEGYLEHHHQRNWIQATIAPLQGGILVTMYNLNPVKSFQQQLTYQIKQLELANAELQQYAYITSHDLQEPLRKIQMFSDIGLSIGPSSKKSKDDMFQKISATASHMRVLIQTLLFFTRSTDQPNEFLAVDLNELIREVQGELEDPILERSAQVLVNKLPFIQGSSMHLKLLFANLISNSIKYSRKDLPPLIYIQTKLVSRDDYDKFNALDQTKQYTCIVVQDNGIGFKPELNEKIFTIFQRLHNKEEIPGAGIGLAICRKIVHQHHGHIFAEGHEGEGATFYVFLPLEQPENEVESQVGISFYATQT